MPSYAKLVGLRNYSKVNGRTIHALELNGLYSFEGRGFRKRGAAAGLAELAAQGRIPLRGLRGVSWRFEIQVQPP